MIPGRQKSSYLYDHFSTLKELLLPSVSQKRKKKAMIFIYFSLIFSFIFTLQIQLFVKKNHIV